LHHSEFLEKVYPGISILFFVFSFIRIIFGVLNSMLGDDAVN